MKEYLLDLSIIESMGFDTIIQFAHSTPEYEGGHVFHITKPSGQSIVWVKSDSKESAIKEGIKKFNKLKL